MDRSLYDVSKTKEGPGGRISGANNIPFQDKRFTL
jgi:hypothetical protein